MNSEHAVRLASSEAGWNLSSQVSILCDFIDDNGLQQDLDRYLSDRSDAEGEEPRDNGSYFDVSVVDHRNLYTRHSVVKQVPKMDEEYASCHGETEFRDELEGYGHEPEAVDQIVRETRAAPQARWVEIQL